MPKDYLAAHRVAEEDAEQSGVKGMKWGVRRTKAQLAGASTASADKPDDTPSGPPTAAQKYAQLKAQAKAGKASEMSAEDLKFFNARTEALAKINKLNEQKPGWLKKTVQDAILESGESQIKAITNAVAKKYVTDQLLSQLNKKAPETIESAVRKGAAERARKEAIEAGIEKALGRAKS